MRISFSTAGTGLDKSTGYGYMGYNMVTSLQALGHTVPYQDPSVKVQIHTSWPTYYEFFEHQYKIGYTPWESSVLGKGWLEEMNKCDEIWTTSPLCKEWFENAGVKPDIHIFQHGVEEKWSPLRRRPQTKIRFLHMGEPQVHKGGMMALNAFRDAFGDKEDVELVIKSVDYTSLRVKDRKGSILGLPQDIYNNVRLVTTRFELDQLIQFIHNADCLVYPSYGEGFGLMPLECMATGLPVICTEAWAPYKQLLLPNLKLQSKVIESPWPEMHPGNMFEPNYDQLVEMYRDVYDNYDKYATQAHARAKVVHAQYNWLKLTEDAFAHIVQKFSE